MRINKKSPSLITASLDEVPADIRDLIFAGREALKDKNWKDVEDFYNASLQLINKTPVPSVFGLEEIFNSLAILNVEHKRRHDKALEYYNQAIKFAHKRRQFLSEAIININLGHMFFDESRWNEATEHYKTAKTIVTENRLANDLVSTIDQYINDVIAAQTFSIGFVSSYGDTNELTPDQVFELYYEKSRLLLMMEEWKDAEGSLRLALDQTEKLKKTGLKAIVLNDLAFTLKVQGKVEEAKDLYEQAIVLSRANNDGKTLATSLNNLGLLYKDLGEYSVAIQQFSESLKIKQSWNDSKSVSNTYYNIAATYLASNEYMEALSYIEKAIAIDKNSDEFQFAQDIELKSRILKAKSSYN